MRAERPSRDGRTASFADNLYPQDGQHLPYFELNPAVRRTARAGRLPLGKPATFASSLQAPGTRPAKTMLHSLVKAAKFDRRPKRSQEHNPFVLGAPPHAPLMRRPRRGRRFYESRYSLSPQSPANGSAQSTAQIQAPCSAQRGAKTVTGFRTRRTVAAQSTAVRFRSRSAGAARHPKDGRATEFSHTVEFFRAPARFILFRLTPK